MNAAMNKPTIMVVDDDEFIQKLLDDTLNAEGFKVVLAGSSEETYQSLRKIVPNLFVIDIILPGQNGFELCKTLKERTDTKNVPILILSSKHTVSDRVKGLKIGADDYLVKPFHFEELVARVQALLRRLPEKPHAAEPLRPQAVVIPAQPPQKEDVLSGRKKAALDHFKERMFEEALQLWEELNRDAPKDIEVKKYIEITRTQLMKKYLEILESKDSVPIRTSNRPEDFVGLDFNSEEGFIFSRIDGRTDLKGIVAISGMKPLKAYGILYNFKKSGVIRLKI
jgi:DNA-binding response OmpR family regulator